MKNSRKSLTATLLLLTFSIATVFGQTGHGYDRASLDPNTAACTDFYQYANGGWMAANPIPAAYPSWGVANMLVEKNRDVLHEILEAAAKNATAKKGSNEQKVGDYYATCMDEAKIEAAGLTPLQPELDRIAKLKDQKALQAAESLWIQFRDANCEVEHGLYKGGTAAPMVLNACLEALTRQRADDLMIMLGYRLAR